MPLPFQTLQTPVSVSGVALHCGLPIRATLYPCENPGFTFRRVDLPGQPSIPAIFNNVVATHHATVLKSGAATVSTTEHLLAALYGMGVTHCEIELDGPEVPILDGSALPWVKAIQNSGMRNLGGNRPVLKLQKPVIWESGAAKIVGLPLESEFRVTVEIEFDHPYLLSQTFASLISPESFTQQIAPARTFTLEAWLEPLRAAGLIRGGSLENAVVFFTDGPSSPPRLENEQARHKTLDLIGDLALLLGEKQFCGQIFAARGGHGAHRGWMETAMRHGF